jgi:hypothetical protein
MNGFNVYFDKITEELNNNHIIQDMYIYLVNTSEYGNYPKVKRITKADVRCMWYMEGDNDIIFEVAGNKINMGNYIELINKRDYDIRDTIIDKLLIIIDKPMPAITFEVFKNDILTIMEQYQQSIDNLTDPCGRAQYNNYACIYKQEDVNTIRKYQHSDICNEAIKKKKEDK